MLRPVRVWRQVLLAELDSLLLMIRFLQASFGTCQNMTDAMGGYPEI